MSHADLEAGKVIRMSLLFREQHLLLTVLLTVLAVTGFALMYWNGRVAPMSVVGRSRSPAAATKRSTDSTR